MKKTWIALVLALCLLICGCGGMEINASQDSQSPENTFDSPGETPENTGEVASAVDITDEDVVGTPESSDNSVNSEGNVNETANKTEGDFIEAEDDTDIPADGYKVILFGKEIFCGFNNGEWISDRQTVKDILDRTLSDEITFIDISNQQGGMVIGYFSIPDYNGTYEQEVQEVKNILGEAGFYIVDLDRRDLLKNAVALDANDPTYLSIISEILIDNGLSEVPPIIKQIYSIDLDNDGNMETIIVAGNINGASAPYIKDTYSLIVLITYIDGEMKTDLWSSVFYLDDVVIKEGVFPSPSEFFGVFGFIDIKGDGCYQTIAYHFGFESGYIGIYELLDGKLVHAKM
jgi:hypothetical protein